MKNILYRLFVAIMLLSILVTACAQPTAEPQTASEAPTEVMEEEPTEVMEELTEAEGEPTEAAAATEPAAETTEEEPAGLPSVDGILPGVDPAAVSGAIISAGSSTVFPLSEAIAARFEDEGFSGEITIDSIGSGAGYERFCVTGESDIA
ncbi:MAG TPA: hypothetical protein VI451_20810, partial [Anaerolineales bacterium]|nr:hypothetical protein [Anaerolineales bacterium]